MKNYGFEMDNTIIKELFPTKNCVVNTKNDSKTILDRKLIGTLRKDEETLKLQGDSTIVSADLLDDTTKSDCHMSKDSISLSENSAAEDEISDSFESLSNFSNNFSNFLDF